MKSLPKETRGEIVEMLKKHLALTAGDIAKRLDLHAMTVRQHLSILERQGYIEHYREKIGRGRPVYMYKLTSEAETELFPGNYPQFALSLLDTLAATDGIEKVNDLLRVQMEERFIKHFEDGSCYSLDDRVKLLADLLNEEGYMVEIEDTPDAFLIREHNCALGPIAKKYRQLCSHELTLFKRLLNAPVERQCHMATGDAVCSYRVPKLHLA